MSFTISPFRFLSGLFLCLLLFQNCSHKKGKKAATHPNSNKEVQAVPVHYAKGFSIQKHPNYTLIKVFDPFQDQTDTLRYMLVSRGKSLPDHLGTAQVIRTPVRSMIATSTTHIALTEMLNSDEVVKGMVGAQYAYSGDIRRRLKQGDITPFTQGTFNNEVALDMHPDLLMVSAGQVAQYKQYQLLIDSGIAVFVNAEWLEKTPLGKAEWLKVMGALLGKGKLAEKKFEEVAQRYNQLKAKAQQAESKPLVINNMPYKGAWFVSGGRSFTAQYLRDAGADYLWFGNHSTGGLRLDFETVYQAGLHADVWLNPGTAVSRRDVLAVDSRFKDFKSYKSGRIYNNNKRMSNSGGNDFWEIGVVRPDLILSDLIQILHPGLVKEDSLYFYQKVK